MTRNSLRLKFVNKTSISNLSETLDMSSATARVAPDMSQALAILSDANVRRSAVIIIVTTKGNKSVQLKAGSR